MADLYNGCHVIIINVGLVFWNCCIEKGGDGCSSYYSMFECFCDSQIKKKPFLIFCSLACVLKAETHKWCQVK